MPESLEKKLDLAISGNQAVYEKLEHVESSFRLGKVVLLVLSLMIVLWPLSIGLVAYHNSTENCHAINQLKRGNITDAETLISVAAMTNPSVRESPGAKAYLDGIRANNKPLDCTRTPW